MLLEHTRKNKAEALRIVDDGLDLVSGRSDFASLEDDLLKRRARLTRVKKSDYRLKEFDAARPGKP